MVTVKLIDLSKEEVKNLSQALEEQEKNEDRMLAGFSASLPAGQWASYIKGLGTRQVVVYRGHGWRQAEMFRTRTFETLEEALAEAVALS